MITWIKKANNFHKQRQFSLRVLLYFYLIFCQVQPDAGYKSVAYKKKLVFALVLRIYKNFSVLE